MGKIRPEEMPLSLSETILFNFYFLDLMYIPILIFFLTRHKNNGTRYRTIAFWSCFIKHEHTLYVFFYIKDCLQFHSSVIFFFHLKIYFPNFYLIPVIFLSIQVIALCLTKTHDIFHLTILSYVTVFCHLKIREHEQIFCYKTYA